MKLFIAGNLKDIKQEGSLLEDRYKSLQVNNDILRTELHCVSCRGGT